jgi:hypothetical protein
MEAFVLQRGFQLSLKPPVPNNPHAPTPRPLAKTISHIPDVDRCRARVMVAADPLAHIFHTTVVAGVPGYRRKVDVREGLAVHEIYIPLTTSPAEFCCSNLGENSATVLVFCSLRWCSDSEHEEGSGVLSPPDSGRHEHTRVEERLAKWAHKSAPTPTSCRAWHVGPTCRCHGIRVRWTGRGWHAGPTCQRRRMKGWRVKLGLGVTLGLGGGWHRCDRAGLFGEVGPGWGSLFFVFLWFIPISPSFLLSTSNSNFESQIIFDLRSRI